MAFLMLLCVYIRSNRHVLAKEPMINGYIQVWWQTGKVDMIDLCRLLTGLYYACHILRPSRRRSTHSSHTRYGISGREKKMGMSNPKITGLPQRHLGHCLSGLEGLFYNQCFMYLTGHDDQASPNRDYNLFPYSVNIRLVHFLPDYSKTMYLCLENVLHC